MPVPGADALRQITNRNNLGNLSNRDKVKDYVVLFVLTFALSRYLTMTAVAIMFGSVLCFHLTRGVSYHEEAPGGSACAHMAPCTWSRAKNLHMTRQVDKNTCT